MCTIKNNCLIHFSLQTPDARLYNILKVIFLQIKIGSSYYEYYITC